MPTLLSLPPEILSRIFRYFTLADHASMSQVHSSFHALLTSNPLAYHFACQVAGVVDNPYCGLGLWERAGALERLERGWGQLHGIFQFDFHTTIRTGDRIYRQGVSDMAHQPYLRDGVISGLIGDAEGKGKAAVMHCLAIPMTESEPVEWRSIDIDIEKDAQVLMYDVSVYDNDLLVLATAYRKQPSSGLVMPYVLELRFMQLSSGAPHPAAQTPTLVVDTSPHAFPTCHFHLAGDHSVVSAHDWIKVINWRTRVLSMEMKGNGINSAPIFLSPHLLLFANEDPRGPSLDIYAIPSDSDSDLDSEVPARHREGPATPLLRLAFPTLRNHTTIDLTCTADTRHFSPRPTSVSSKPFHATPANAIFCVVVDPHHNAEDLLFMVVQWSALLELCMEFQHQRRLQRESDKDSDSDKDSSAESTDATLLPWDTWGPSVAR
ncbi:hypothetical protein H0H92_001419 [Tricholoma furcatifolium]|nr:hypothetical protein H0H92_001419 [Tricholoma furcatifolium]